MTLFFFFMLVTVGTAMTTSWSGAAGDLDGDNVSDVAVGAANYGHHSSYPFIGAVFILFLHENGTVKNQQKITQNTANFQGSLAWEDGFGGSIAVIGDLNEDGIPDILVGAPGDDDGGSYFGAAYVLFLERNGTVKSHQKICNSEGNFSGLSTSGFGNSAAGIGDLDEDGIPDVAVGAWADSGDKGALWILFMNRNGTVKRSHKIIPEEAGDQFGSSVAALGDVDGDRHMDLAVGSHHDDDGGQNSGAVYVLFMNRNGTVRTLQKISLLHGGFSGPLEHETAARFGLSATALGDANGDNIPDVAVGAVCEFSSCFGEVWILFLNGSGWVKSSSKISAFETEREDEQDWFGSSISTIGDLNGDKIPELMIGAEYDDDSNNMAGAVYIIFNDVPPSTSSTATTTSSSTITSTSSTTTTSTFTTTSTLPSTSTSTSTTTSTSTSTTTSTSIFTSPSSPTSTTSTSPSSSTSSSTSTSTTTSISATTMSSIADTTAISTSTTSSSVPHSTTPSSAYNSATTSHVTSTTEDPSSAFTNSITSQTDGTTTLDNSSRDGFDFMNLEFWALIVGIPSVLSIFCAFSAFLFRHFREKREARLSKFGSLLKSALRDGMIENFELEDLDAERTLLKITAEEQKKAFTTYAKTTEVDFLRAAIKGHNGNLNAISHDYSWFNDIVSRVADRISIEDEDEESTSDEEITMQDLKDCAIPFDELEITKKLGEGAFGAVHKAIYNSGPAVVKTLKSGDRQEFLSEVRQLKNLKGHSAVCQFFGACIDPNSTLAIVLEYIRGGNLEEMIHDPNVILSPLDVFSLMKDLASGMCHLHKGKVMHCDLAPRNLLVLDGPHPLSLKVSDFGLSKVLPVGKDSVSTEGWKIPIRWAAPEVFSGKMRFFQASDVWSFGIVCWEVLTRERPYPKLQTNEEVMEYVQEGNRLLGPEDMKWDAFFELIEDCWNKIPSERPSFEMISHRLNKWLKRGKAKAKEKESEHNDSQFGEFPSDVEMQVPSSKNDSAYHHIYQFSPGS